MSTKIEWTDEVWNPTVGCSKVSSGCSWCYAEVMAKRLKSMGRPEYQDTVNEKGKWTGKITLVPERLDIPLKWKKPRKIFVNSMSDLFHEDVPDEFIDQVFETMHLSWWHTAFQVLTKRPDRMSDYITSRYQPGGTVVLSNVWLGVSCEDQKTADERIPILLETPAARRFVSLEPMLGPIDLDKKELLCYRWRRGATIGIYLDWVIVGGESGQNARPMHPDWVRSIRDQCQEASVPFFFKQWGEWVFRYDRDGPIYERVGKKKAGRMLDGREWNEYPELR